MAGEIFYPPPQPTQGRRFAPIESVAAADQPPPRSNVMAMVAIMVCWQAVSPQPLYQSVLTEEAASVSANPPYKRQPDSIRRAWESYPQPTQKAAGIAPLTLIYGDQPPPFDLTLRYAIRASWEPPDPQPVQKPIAVAPLTLVYGDQPPPLVRRESVRTAWETEAQHTQEQRYAPIPPAEVASDNPPPKADFLPSILASWYQPNLVHLWATGLSEGVTYTPDNPPPLRRQPLPTVEIHNPQQRQTTAPIVAEVVAGDTIPYKRQPAAILESWNEVQAVRISVAAIPVEELEPQPFVRQPQATIDAWYQPYEVRQRRAAAPIATVEATQQQPSQPSAVFSAIIQSWQLQHHYNWRRPQLIFSVRVDDPPPLRQSLLNSLYQINWVPPSPQPQRDLKRIAPLTLVYGDQPPPYSHGILDSILATWVQPHVYRQRLATLGQGSIVAHAALGTMSVVPRAMGCLSPPESRSESGNLTITARAAGTMNLIN